MLTEPIYVIKLGGLIELKQVLSSGKSQELKDTLGWEYCSTRSSSILTPPNNRLHPFAVTLESDYSSIFAVDVTTL